MPVFGRQPSNQIKVELQLLQDDNIRLLKDFGDQWSSGVEKLSKEIRQSMGDRYGTTAVAAGGETASDSRRMDDVRERAAAGSRHSSEPQPGQGPGMYVPGSGGRAQWIPMAQQANTVLPSAAAAAAMATMDRPGDAASGSGILSKAGRVATSPFRALGSMIPPDQADMYGTMLGQMLGGNTGMIIGGLAGGMLGKPGAAKNALRAAPLALGGAALAFQHQNFGIGGMPLGGLNLNYDAQEYGNAGGLNTQGFLGTALGSEAWKANMQAQIQASQRGRWTIGEIPGVGGVLGALGPVGGMIGAIGISNPKYNSRQANEAMALTKAYGWGLDPDDPYTMAVRDTALDYMGKMSKQFPGIPQEEMMKAMEPVRYGTGTFEGAEAAVTGMAEAARAAHMELGVFAQRAGAAAMAMHQQMGTPYQTALKDVSSFTTATGLPPEAAQGFMTDTGAYLEMSRTGKGVYDSFFGKDANIGKMRGQLSMIGELADPKYWQSIKNDPAKLEEAKNQLTWWWKADPKFLGGMSPPDFLALMMRGKSPVDKASGVSHILNAQTTADMAMGLRKAGESDHMVQSYSKIINEWGKGGLDKAEMKAVRARGHGAMANYIKKQKLFQKGDDAAQRKKDARQLGQWIIGKDTRTGKGVKDAQKVTLDIKAPYDQIFKQMIHKHKAKAAANQNPQAKGSRGDATADGFGWDDLKPHGWDLESGMDDWIDKGEDWVGDKYGDAAGWGKDKAGDIGGAIKDNLNPLDW